MSKKSDKKTLELDKSQIPLFGQADNSVNQTRVVEIELKLKDGWWSPYSSRAWKADSTKNLLDKTDCSKA